MRQLAIVAFLVFTLITSVFGLAQAQTPAPQAAEQPPSSAPIPGATLEILAATASESGAVGMTIYRIALEPDVQIPEHEHDGSVTWHVDAGTLGYTVTSGEAWVRCAAACVPGETPDPSGFVQVHEGQEVVLEAGDWVIQHDTTVHAYRNAGEDTVVIYATATNSLLERACGGGCF